VHQLQDITDALLWNRCSLWRCAWQLGQNGKLGILISCLRLEDRSVWSCMTNPKPTDTNWEIPAVHRQPTLQWDVVCCYRQLPESSEAADQVSKLRGQWTVETVLFCLTSCWGVRPLALWDKRQSASPSRSPSRHLWTSSAVHRQLLEAPETSRTTHGLRTNKRSEN